VHGSTQVFTAAGGEQNGVLNRLPVVHHMTVADPQDDESLPEKFNVPIAILLVVVPEVV
jgi:hypothetical protein